jgi:GntR family transcriptional repressor for pyruvate dehydrogenase complex
MGKTLIARRRCCAIILRMSDKLITCIRSPVQRPPRLSDTVSREIEAWIGELGLVPGTQLPTEKLLCERFGVSRAVVREAISRLKAEGCVETRQGLGAFVAAAPGESSFRLVRESAPAQEDVADTFELRAMVESGAAELAAQRRTPESLSRIAAAVDEMERALQAGEGGAAADDAFHVAIAAASGNRQLARFLIYMGRQFSESRLPTWSEEGHLAGRAASAQAEHRRIFAAIQLGDARAAGEAARVHLEAAACRLGSVVRHENRIEGGFNRAGKHGETA